MYNQHHHPKAKAIPIFRHLVTAISISRQSKARQDKILCEPSNSRVYHTTQQNPSSSLLVVATRKAVRSVIRSAAQAGRTNAVRWELAVSQSETPTFLFAHPASIETTCIPPIAVCLRGQATYYLIRRDLNDGTPALPACMNANAYTTSHNIAAQHSTAHLSHPATLTARARKGKSWEM